MSSAFVNNSVENLQLYGHNKNEKDAPKPRVKRRIRQFSDSDSDKEVMQDASRKLSSEKQYQTPQESDNDNNEVIIRSIPRKSRILKASRDSSVDSVSSNSDQKVEKSESKEKPKLPQSDSDSETAILKRVSHTSKQKVGNGSASDSELAVKYEQQQMRMKNKRNKMKNKFKSLINSREKDQSSAGAEIEPTKSNNSSDSDNNVEDYSSIEKIKQKIKERMPYKPSICDPDTSDEETESIQQKSIPKQKKEKRTKLTSPKPQRMSAKQAMENMQKIKSESNRMLREKEVSLPYHRPKALSLKDIMSRRKPAISSDGKCLPIKMNGEQLKQYAQILEDRQKQMMELWQSDTDEEIDDNKSDDEKSIAKANKQAEAISISNPKVVESTVIENGEFVNNDISAENNDKLYDVLSQSIIEETNTNNSKVNEINQKSINDDKVPEEQDSESSMKLVFNDSETSITEEKQENTNGFIKEGTAFEANIVNETNNEHEVLEHTEPNTESDSQLVSLHYDSEKLANTDTLQTEYKSDEENAEKTADEIDNVDREFEAMDVDNGFSDDDTNIEDIDNIIENAEIIRDIEDKVNSQVLIRDRPLNLKPKLTGAPGMVIDLDNSATLPKKSGVELLKERFTFFCKLKTPEELERDNDRKTKPGNMHLRLRQELEEQMAEQRSLEWAKRLEDEKQRQNEMQELHGEESGDENNIDKIEAKLEEGNEENDADDSESEDELLENDVELKDKPRAKNPMLENEAEESDCDENEVKGGEDDEVDQENAELNDGDDDNDVDAESSDESESSESEEEQPTTKKGRILKAFEDSDDDDTTKVEESKGDAGSFDLLGSQMTSQDDVLTLAQRHKSVSEDLFTSQGSSLLASQKAKSEAAPESLENDTELGTQTFSILDSTNNATDLLNSSDKSVVCETQPYDNNLDAVAAMCSGSFSQSLPPLPITQISQSQAIGEDILALCTGKFYGNEFVSQITDNQTPLGASQDDASLDCDSQILDKGDETQENNSQVETEANTEVNNQIIDIVNEQNVNTINDIEITTSNKVNKSRKVVDDNLKSILDELDDPEFDLPKPNRFFCGAKSQEETQNKQEETQKEQEVVKKKFIIDSDDDNDANASETKKRKKLKKKRPEKRALQISDDEDEQMSEQEDAEDYESDIEKENEERLVEYDSEENEIEVIPQYQNHSKKKRKGNEFFEQEAELTSEDEWVGSGDEDEAGLDRMEREAGDDESFHQGRLQRELGQIHMRDVLDQDKREVRIIQELLFEDGDLGAGGRQRKFKWKNLDGSEETGAGNDEFRDTQEGEFESEEQWRKQRHERETYLRQMQNNGDHDDSLNVSINRTTIIKANLMSRTMSTLLEEHQPALKNTDSPVEEKTAKDIPSPQKPFSLLQQNYQGSILNRGKGALARLAALATPLAVDDDVPKGKSAASGNRRNFVFATLTPEPPKVTKRKAIANPSTPALVKKMKTEEKQNMSKSSLLDRMKV